VIWVCFHLDHPHCKNHFVNVMLNKANLGSNSAHTKRADTKMFDFSWKECLLNSEHDYEILLFDDYGGSRRERAVKTVGNIDHNQRCGLHRR
jgi:hypothetical protein